MPDENVYRSDDADYVKPPSSPPKLTRIIGKPWNQQTHAGENELWYNRFKQYLQLGTSRSVSLAATGRRNAYPMPTHWMVISRDYLWRLRGIAWDKAGSPELPDAKQTPRKHPGNLPTRLYRGMPRMEPPNVLANGTPKPVAKRPSRELPPTEPDPNESETIEDEQSLVELHERTDGAFTTETEKSTQSH